MGAMTIAEFAAAAGVSRQAVYKRVDKDLSPYCHTVDGKKLLDDAALSLFCLPDEGQEAADTPLLDRLKEQLAERDREIQRLREELTDIRKELSLQLEQNRQLQTHIMEQSTSATELLRNMQVLLAQQQKLPEVSTVESVDTDDNQKAESLQVEVDKRSEKHEENKRFSLFNLFTRS